MAVEALSLFFPADYPRDCSARHRLGHIRTVQPVGVRRGIEGTALVVRLFHSLSIGAQHGLRAIILRPRGRGIFRAPGRTRLSRVGCRHDRLQGAVPNSLSRKHGWAGRSVRQRTDINISFNPCEPAAGIRTEGSEQAHQAVVVDPAAMADRRGRFLKHIALRQRDRPKPGEVPLPLGTPAERREADF
jgi:hypothetical protein